MTAPDFREALAEVIESNAAWAVDPVSSQVDAVLSLLAERLDGDEVEMAVAKAILDARRHRWDQVHEGECITDARTALAAVCDHLGVQRARPTRQACRHEESLWGRCVACGMTWEQQAKERDDADA